MEKKTLVAYSTYGHASSYCSYSCFRTGLRTGSLYIYTLLKNNFIMEFLSYIALILLSLAGYSAGVSKASHGRAATPFLTDLIAGALLVFAAVFLRSFLGKWLTIPVSFCVGFLSAYLKTCLIKNRYPEIHNDFNDYCDSGSVSGRIWNRWKYFARQMGNFQSRMILGFFYFLIVTPFAVVLKIFSNPLQFRSFNNKPDWLKKDPSEDNMERARERF